MFSLNDLVYHDLFGEGVIIRVNFKRGSYPISVKFNNQSNVEYFTFTGKYYLLDVQSSLIKLECEAA